MTVKQTNKAVALFRKSIIEDLIIELKRTEFFKDDDIELIKETLTNSPLKNKKKRAPPKIEEKKRCKSICKNGARCVVPICDYNLKKCWAHMDKKERESYRLKKALKSI